MAETKIETQLMQLADIEAKLLQKQLGKDPKGIVSTQVLGLARATGKILAALQKRLMEAGL